MNGTACEWTSIDEQVDHSKCSIQFLQVVEVRRVGGHGRL